MGYSLWDHRESDTTERLHSHRAHRVSKQQNTGRLIEGAASGTPPDF